MLLSMMFVKHSNHYEVAKVLLEKGSDVNEGECKGLTVVHAAAHFGFFRILNLLLAQPNCLINAQVLYQWTILS